MIETLSPIIRFVRETSPYFAELYSDLPDDATLKDLPVVDHTEFWKASNRDRRNVMTSPQIDGVVLKTGGTTSRPKTTAYSQVELQRTASLLANGLLSGGVRAGDRIFNAFYAGDLYGSFLLHVLSIMALPVPAVHLPVGGFTGVAEAVGLMEQCEATVILTTATSLVKVAILINLTSRPIDAVRCVLFGGEPLFPEQAQIIRKAFPRASIKPCIYGTIDSGVIAMSAPGDDTQVYQAFTESVVVEILRNDGSGETIEENGQTGTLVATNTVRQLCPVLRYPTGDQAAWINKERGLFRLLGRAGQAVRLGPVSIDMVDIRSIVAETLPDALVEGVQAVISRTNGLDQLECVIAMPLTDGHGGGATNVEAAIEASLYLQSPMFKQHVELGLVAPLSVRFVDVGGLQLARGSHKLLEIVDKRF